MGGSLSRLMLPVRLLGIIIRTSASTFLSKFNRLLLVLLSVLIDGPLSIPNVCTIVRLAPVPNSIVDESRINAFL